MSATLTTHRRAFMLGSGAALTAVLRTPAKAAEFEFKFGSPFPIADARNVRLVQMWEAVKHESGGRINVQFFPDSVLGGDGPMFKQLRLGALHFQLLNSGFLAGVVPIADIVYVAYAFKDTEEAVRVFDGPVGDYFRREITAKGLHTMRTMWNSGMYQLGISTGAKPIHTPDDLHAFKVRVTESKIQLDFFRLFGAIPTTLNTNEVYTALQTRLVDGTAHALVTIESERFYEVQRAVSLTNHCWAGTTVTANGDAWNSLPHDLQEIVERNNTKYARIELQDSKAFELSLIDKLARQGNQMVKVDPAPFRKNLKPYYDTWSKAFGPTAWDLLQSSISNKLA